MDLSTIESIETISAIVLGSAALLPLTVYALRRYSLGLKVMCSAGVFLLMCAALWAGIQLRPPVVHESEVEHRPIEVANGGYVSSKSCRACHPQHHATWLASYHSRMTQVATTESVAGDFNDVELHRGDRDYLLSEQDGEFFVRTKKSGDSEYGSRRRRIVMTTGSHHRQWVWAETGDSRKIVAFPFLYLIPQQRWIPLESSFLIPPHQNLGFGKGEWNENCIQCHTTQGRTRKQRLRQGEFSMDTHVVEFGIACEACHGPAEQHILANRDPLRRYRLRAGDEPDPTIVNPKHLSAELSGHVCGQCHAALSLFKTKDQQTYERFNRSGFAFRPGQNLGDSRYLFGYPPHMQSELISSFIESNPDYVPNRFWSDGIVRVAGREFSGLLATPCYTHGQGSIQMSCLSCHAMHQPEQDERSLSAWANDQLKPELAGNQACTQCHEDFSSTEQLEAHTHHAASSSASLCYNCHMPYTTFGLLKAIRSHGLVSPSVQSSLETGRPNACNQCHLDRTLDWTAGYLHDWFNLTRPELQQDERQIAASVLWSLKGDAGQRALMAWSMGWKDAREASGGDWTIPYLAELLKDPYDAVRFVAHESLKSVDASGTSAAKYDFLAPVAEREQAADQIRQRWNDRHGSPTAGAGAVLIDVDGQLQQDELDRLLQERDHRPVSLLE